MAAQSLLFDRSAGWTAVKAKAWAKSHGYLYGKVDVTDQYIRIRQFDPKGFKVKRTIPFGRGIRAVVAREESMRTTTAKEAPRRRRSSKKKTTASKRPRRRARKAAAVTTRRRRRKVQAAKRSSHMMEASKRRRTKRRPARAAEAWKGDSAGHAKAARKGHRRSKARKARKAGRRRSKRTRETMYAAAPRRRRHAKRTREPMVMEAKRRTRRRYHAHAAKSRSGGMSPAEFGLAIVSAGFGFVLADGLDRMLATYDPTAATKPTDKFTSDGAGTLANTLNVASTPDWKRLVAGIGMTAVPAVGSMYVKNPLLKSSAEGLAIGAGVSLFKTLWSNVLMPLLVGKDTTTPALQKSYIARLYPAEVAAHINSRKTNDAGAAVTPQMAVSSAGSGALSGAPAQQAPSYPAPGLGAPALDVGPFALAGSSDYPSAAEALRAAAGVGASAAGGLLPTASQAMGMGASASGGLLPTVAQTLGASAAGGLLPTASQAMGMGTPYMPGPPPGPGPGPQIERGADPAACGCIGDDNQFLGFVGDEAADGTLASSSMT
jgi:hypothetical protein